LSFEISIVGRSPQPDAVVQIVENKISFVGADSEYSVPLPVGLPNDRKEEIRERQTFAAQPLPFLEGKILTVAAPLRIGPDLLASVVV